MVILTNNMKKYLESSEKKGYNKSEYNSRIIVYAKDGLKDLAYLLEKKDPAKPLIPAEVRAEIFNANTLKPLFHAFFHIDNESTSEERRRVLNICYLALDQIAQLRPEIPLLAPNAWKVLSETPSSNAEETYGTKVIQAIQIEATKFRS